MMLDVFCVVDLWSKRRRNFLNYLFFWFWRKGSAVFCFVLEIRRNRYKRVEENISLLLIERKKERKKERKTFLVSERWLLNDLTKSVEETASGEQPGTNKTFQNLKVEVPTPTVCRQLHNYGIVPGTFLQIQMAYLLMIWVQLSFLPFMLIRISKSKDFSSCI